MTPNATAALTEAYRLVHMALRLAGDWIAAGLTRAIAGKARRALQRGEAALRRATLILAGDMEPAPALHTAIVGKAPRRPAETSGRSARPRALALMEPLPRTGRSGRPFPADFGHAEPSDPVACEPLAARLERLRRAFIDPVGRARRMRRLLDRRQRHRPPLRPGPPPGLPRGQDPHGWRRYLAWIDAAARDVLVRHPAPG